MFDKMSEYNERFQEYFERHDSLYCDEELANSPQFRIIGASLTDEFQALCKNYILDCNINGIFEIPMREGMFLSTDLVNKGVSTYGTIGAILTRVLLPRGILVSVFYPALIDEREIGFDSFDNILEIMFLQPNSTIELLDVGEAYSMAQLKMFEEALKLRESYHAK